MLNYYFIHIIEITTYTITIPLFQIRQNNNIIKKKKGDGRERSNIRFQYTTSDEIKQKKSSKSSYYYGKQKKIKKGEMEKGYNKYNTVQYKKTQKKVK